MLIITRRVDETLMIGDDVTITVLGVKGNQVRIGVNAPKETQIDREEIRQRKDRDAQAMQHLTVYDCNFEHKGSPLHVEIAAQSEDELHAYLNQQYPGYDEDSLNTIVSWAPNLLKHAMTGQLDPADHDTFTLLRRTLNTYDNKTPCALLCRDIHKVAA